MHKMNHTTKEYCDPLREHTAKIDKVIPALGRKRNRSLFEHFKKNAPTPITPKQMKLEIL